MRSSRNGKGTQVRDGKRVAWSAVLALAATGSLTAAEDLDDLQFRIGFLTGITEYDIDASGISLDADGEWDQQYGVFARAQSDFSLDLVHFVHSGFTLRFRELDAEDIGAFDDDLYVETLMLDWHFGYGARFGSLRMEVEGALGVGFAEAELFAPGVVGEVSPAMFAPVDQPLQDVTLIGGVGLHAALRYDIADHWQVGLGGSVIYQAASFDLASEANGVNFSDEMELISFGVEGFGFVGVRF